MYSILVGAINQYLKKYDIHFTIGTQMLALDWIASAFSIGAGLFWVISICCCSGKSSRKNRNAGPAPGQGFTGYAPFGNRGYAPLGEEGGQQAGKVTHGAHNAPGMEMQDFGYSGAGYKGSQGGAYEPFRHG
jgi:hypothetical protein